MKNIGSIAIIGWLVLSIVSAVALCTGAFTEKGNELKSIPREFQGNFVETTEATALGGLSPIRIQVVNSTVRVNDPNQDEPVEYAVIKVIKYDKHIDLYYPKRTTYSSSCIRIYPIEGLFYFYEAEIEGEGPGRDEFGIGGPFTKTL